jgi:hypothetical protein
VLAVHIGPAADDSVATIPSGYRSQVAGTLILAELGTFLAALLGLAVLDVLLVRRGLRTAAQRREGAAPVPPGGGRERRPAL